jgi:hypothetical protein
MRPVAGALALLLAALLAAPLAACAAAPDAALADESTAGGPRAVELPATVTLAPGERVIARGPDLAVRFAGVSEDSRCPEGVTCVWAGRAVVQVEVGDGEAPTVPLEVGGEPRVVRGLALAAEALDPYPRADAATRPEDYRLRLRIERAGT